MRAATYFIVAFSLTSCHPTYAEDIAITNNQIGGRTVLTDKTCRYDKNLPEAYSTDDKGHVSYACYWAGHKKIFFQTQDGTVRTLLKTDFDLLKMLI